MPNGELNNSIKTSADTMYRLDSDTSIKCKHMTIYQLPGAHNKKRMCALHSLAGRWIISIKKINFLLYMYFHRAF